MSDSNSVGSALRQLMMLMSPPARGGDAVDWDAARKSSGIILPDDYCGFVEVYGGGEIDSHMSIMIPPAPGYPYGSYWSGAPKPLGPSLAESIPEWLRGAKVLRYGSNGDGDDIYWLCGSADPNRWETVVYKRHPLGREESWKRFPLGMVDFWVSLIRGDIENPFSAGDFPDRRPTYRSWREDGPTL